MRRLVMVGLLISILAVAGCGGGDDSGNGGGGGGGATTTPSGATTPSGGGGAGGEDGKALFAGTCGGCHTLADAGTTGTIGPNLDEVKPDKQTVLDAIKTGPGQMPENLFQGAQADEVATYVSSVAGKS